ncbi:hypothetical protein P8452_39965 [Trifolium repens]|nr:hypothetical protein P8452_39965 [Trifolium repens]
MAKKMNLSFLMFVMIGCIIFVSVSSTTHIVGDSLGWSMPNYIGYFEDWSKNKTFAVGDTLVFQYNPGMSTVVQVDKNDYGNCTSRNTLRTYFRGNSSVVLDKPGDYYFFCSVGKRCEAGQKLWVNVQGKPSSQ